MAALGRQRGVALVALVMATGMALPATVGADRRTPGRPRQAERVPPALTARAEAPSDRLGGAAELQGAVASARDAVLPALVHVEPIIEVFRRGQRAREAITGSGVIVSPDGHVLTNDHVVAHAERVSCVLDDRREYPARVVGRDTFTDVAVLQLETDGEEVPWAELGTSSTLEAGQFVIAMGSPLGLARSLSVGVVSTPDRYFPEDFLPSGQITGTYNTWIQTDAAINPGNSGGPLVDLSGRVVGINARAVPIFGENLAFAIPIDVVREVARELVEHGRVRRAWIGVRWQHLKALAEHFGTEARGGVLVGGVVAGGPADLAGLRPGDVLVAWDDDPVSVRFEEELPAFRKRVADSDLSRPVTVTLLRRGRDVRLEVQPALRPATEAEETAFESWGLTAKDITPDLARAHRLTDRRGALVTGVRSAGPADVAGLREGDAIRWVESERVDDTRGLVELARRLAERGTTRVLVKADRGTTVRLAVIEPNGGE